MFTESWPSCVQYTSCSRKIIANSSSTREAPTPISSAARYVHADTGGAPTAVKPPAISRITPGVEWCMCTPPLVML